MSTLHCLLLLLIIVADAEFNVITGGHWEVIEGGQIGLDEDKLLDATVPQLRVDEACSQEVTQCQLDSLVATSYELTQHSNTATQKYPWLCDSPTYNRIKPNKT